jgi:hypothetical protein
VYFDRSIDTPGVGRRGGGTRLGGATAGDWCFDGIARRFYERCGYVRREVFEGYSEADNSVYYKKRLDSSLVAPILLDGHDAKGHDG